MADLTTDLQLTAPADADGERLDRWLARQLPDHSRNTVQDWIKSGRVRVNQRAVRSSHRLVAGDLIEAPAAPLPQASTLHAEDLPLDILYEDADILVVNKPAGMVVHPAAGHQTGTLVHAILYHCPDLVGIGGEKRPGIVHRLDKDTSGVMVVAKHAAALAALQAQFKRRSVYKQYLALVEGNLREDRGEIDAPLGRHPVDRKRQAVFTSAQIDTPTVKARHAVTEFSVIARYTVPVRDSQGYGHFTLVHAHPITGRTHQIRVHFAWRGHPLVGDRIYGLRHQRLIAPRICLHAATLRLCLPSTGEEATFTAPTPPDLAEFLHSLATTAEGVR